MGHSPRRPLRALAAAAALSLGGCYVGFDDGATLSQDSATTAATPEPTTSPDAGESTSGDAQTTGEGTFGEASTGTTTAAPGTTGGPDATTGAIDDSTTTADTTPGTTTVPDGTTTTGAPVDPDVPADNDYCADAVVWDPAWKALEEEILALVNQVRAQGGDCGSKGAFGPAPPLTMDPALRCAARMHSLDMAARNFFDHTNPDGESPWDRMGKAGYGPYANAGENIAAGSDTAAATLDQWMTSDGHCANILNSKFQHLGVGYSTGGQYGHLWTQVFGAK